MSHIYPVAAREALNQIVSDPRFKKLNAAPKLGLQLITFMVFGFTLFSASTWAYFQRDLPYLLLILINGYSMIMMFTAIHEATHRSVSSIDWLNDLIGTVGAFLYMPGMSTTLYRYLHLDHHRYTGDVNKDPDVQYTNAPFLICLSRWVIKDIHWGIWIIKHFEKRSAKEKRAFILGTIAYVTWYTCWFLSPYVTEFVLLYLIPQRIFYCVLLYFFSYIQHPVGILQSEQPFQATVQLNAPKWLHPFIMYQDKHIIHHMFPSLPFYRYPKVWTFAQQLMESQHIIKRNIVEWNWQPEIPKIEKTFLLAVSIEKITNIAQDVNSYQLVSTDGSPLPKFSAGAHIDVHIEQGLVRQYSLCNSPYDARNYTIAVKSEAQGRGGSKKLHELFKEGMVINVSLPRNNFKLSSQAENYQLLAGGIGITPMLAMAHQLHRDNKPFTLHLFARSNQYLPFYQSIQKLKFSDNIKIYFDNEMPLPKRNIENIIGEGSQDKSLYLCGPQPFMDFIIEHAESLNWQNNNIHFEAFSQVILNGDNNKAFELELTKSKRTIQVSANQSIVDAMEKAGINVPVSCGQGICGTCVCKVSKGEVDHRDAILSKKQQTQEHKIALCVSRAKGCSLTIDF